jgi:hypothetical protein
MPSKSPAQHRLMEAAAHTPGGYGGVPQGVGEDFAQADQVKKGKAAVAHALRNSPKKFSANSDGTGAGGGTSGGAG